MSPRPGSTTRRRPAAAAAAAAAGSDGGSSKSASSSTTKKPFVETEARVCKRPTQVRLLGDNFGNRPLLQRLNWLHVPLLTITPALAIYGVLTHPFVLETYIWAVLYYFATGLGITAGYHRLFAHRAYDSTTGMRVAMLLLGAGAVEGSARWWCRDHRAHHRFVDTDRDPYAATRGFWYSHIGWMLVKQDPKKIGRVDIGDLNDDPWCRWQHVHYLPIALVMGFLFPTVVAGLGWGDWRGGFFIAGVARLVFVHHSTFCVNSLAHFAGAQDYSDSHSARNSIITALCTIGEGYHNFHHEFPSDYRNGVRHYQYDPTKWLIRFLSYFGVTFNLKRFPENEIQMGVMQMRQKELDAAKARVSWGPSRADLPTATWEDVKRRVADGEQLVVLDDYVLDVAPFTESHPGGAKILKLKLGKDATEAFFGGVYRHTNAAHNLTKKLRVATIVGPPPASS